MLKLCFFFVCFSLVSCVDNESFEAFAQQLLSGRYYSGVKTIEDARFVTSILEKAFENYTLPDPDLKAFDCPPTGRTNPPPVNARQLKPGDIDLVCALGDSLTAAFGADATSLLNLFTDYRASSFSGGLSNVIDTFPGNLWTFNNNLQGFSTGSGNADSSTARLNVAVSGARADGLIAQVDMLILRLKSFPPESWKHISLFIGGNDLCDVCDYPDYYSPAEYQRRVELAIQGLKSNLKNVFLSLVVPPDVSLLSELTGGWCTVLRPFECSCNTNEGVSEVHRQYIDALHAIEKTINDRSDFFVSVQPFLQDIKLPQNPDGSYDMTYFAPDCFHFSRKAHEAASLALWNNLMESPAEKKREWVIGEPYECPKPDQFLQ